MTGRTVIVGAGVAGTTAARTLRSEGYTGDIVLLGAEPTPPYRRPMVSKEILAGTAEDRRTLLQPNEFWHTHTIDLRLGVTVESIDPGPALVWLSDGTAIGYDTLLLATGARPRALGFAQHRAPGVVHTGIGDEAGLAGAREGAGHTAHRDPAGYDGLRHSGAPVAGIREGGVDPGQEHAGMTGVGDARTNGMGDPRVVRDGEVSRPGIAGGCRQPESASETSGLELGEHSARIHYLRGRTSAEALRAEILAGGSLLIVGAGLIGCEVAATARGLGAEVTVLDAAGGPLARVVPGIVGDYLRTLHASNGVAVHTGVRLARLALDQSGVVAVADDGRCWNAASALVAIGSVPDTRLAEAAGLAVADGIRVDERYRTSAPGIFAAGDAVSRLDPESGEYRREEHWNSAQAQGAGAARSMLGLAAGPAEVPWGWSLQYGRNLQFAGRIREADELVVRGRVEAGDATVLGLRDGCVTGVVAIARPAEFRAARDLIGRGARVDARSCLDESRPLAEALALSGQS